GRVALWLYPSLLSDLASVYQRILVVNWLKNEEKGRHRNSTSYGTSPPRWSKPSTLRSLRFGYKPPKVALAVVRAGNPQGLKAQLRPLLIRLLRAGGGRLARPTLGS
ncbi:MAG: hypothetical protein ACPLRW_12835, partial [Moorellales bacterium]